MGITAAPKDENSLLNWEAVIRGPEPYYAPGSFKVDVNFTNDYPFKVKGRPADYTLPPRSPSTYCT